ncbi:TIR domain-containing protein [Bacillus sp. OV194]|nr:TIR domain-containing protein [Bacillus sp. OV194]
MAEPTKIFISSAAQDRLKPLRENIHTALRAMEHKPLMYEKDFGPWPADQLVENCLQHVERSDIFLLLISDKAGNYSNFYKATITHCEFQKAYQSHKYIIVFVEDYIYDLFWYELRLTIAEMLKAYQEEHGKDPDSYMEVAQKAWIEHPSKEQYSNIEPYIWGFLYDIYKKGHYLEKLPFGIDPIPTIKRYFSDLFRQGSQYLAFQSTIEEQLKQGPIYKKHAEFSGKMIHYLRDGELQNPRMFLEYLQRFLTKGTIYNLPGTMFEQELGVYESCSGSTLYKKEENLLRLISASGMAGGDNNFYDMQDTQSYVVQAFHSGKTELFFSEEKQQFYLAIKCGNYVICFHFPVEGFWSEDKVHHFKDDIMRDIMETESALFRDFAIQLLGGIR